MKCPYCGNEESKVVDKRETDELESNRRRRECLKCGKRFTTYERIERIELNVVKKDGRREAFNREKLISGITKACEKRPVGREKIEAIVNEIESELLQRKETEIPSREIGELVMQRLKKLDEVAFIRFASVYKTFTDVAEFERELKNLKVVEEKSPGDSTDILLQVATHAAGATIGWERSRITEALAKEADLSKDEAEDIAQSVEKKVFASGIKTISVSLIRELVDNELFVRGYEKKLEKQGLIGMPSYNLNQLIYNMSLENSNVRSNSPEAINLAIAENALKQYALREIFSKEVSNAHLKGAMHLHDLGYPIRAYCSAHSLEFIKKYGLRLINLSTASTPAKHAHTLTGHLNTFLASMQAYYAGALGISFVNVFYAPYFVGADFKEMKQQAQYLIFSCSQNAFSRGGQTLFIDFNIHLGVPEFLKKVPAIGPGGKYTGKTYGEYEKETQLFAKALMDVWREGDGDGKPFPFPKMDLHVNQESFDDPRQFELLKYACLISSENGAPYFAFDRDAVNLSMCCRLRTKLTDNYVLEHPESIRYCGFQNVTINLPQAAYRAGKGNSEKCIEEVRNTMDLAMKAHLEKKEFISTLMKENGPLWQVGKISPDGIPYLDLDKATYIIGLIGLNECVKHLVGKELHESEEAFKLGLKIISAMNLKARELEKKTGLRVALEESPAESASLRLARVDLKEFPESREYVRGNKETREVYYTNSIHLTPDAPVSISERIEKQGKFNPLIESGAITHVFLGEQRPEPEAILNLVKKTWENTQSDQIVISPEFTVCEDCNRVSPGYKRKKSGGNLNERKGK